MIGVARRVVVFGLMTCGLLFNAQAATVDASNEATEDLSGSTPSYFFPIVGSGVCAVTGKTYPTTLVRIDTTDATQGLIFSVTPTKELDDINGTSGTIPAAGTLSIHVEYDDTPIRLIDYDGAGFQDAGQTYLKYNSVVQESKRFGIYLPSATGLCNVAFGGAADCPAAIGNSPTSKNLVIGITKGTDSFDGNTDADTETVKITLVSCPPYEGANPASPELNFGIINGDQRVKIANSTTAPTDVVDLSKVIVFGSRTGAQPTTDNADVIREFSDTAAGAVFTVDGLANDTRYCFSFGYVNVGGLMSTTTTWDSTLPTIDASSHCATPSKVDGFLDRSTCFIASAAYGDEWNPRLETLRQFRDQILGQTETGRRFINWYYSWSPKAAGWLFSHPGYQIAVRAILLPVVETARAVLWLKQNMWALGVLLIAGTMGVLAMRLRVESEPNAK